MAAMNQGTPTSDREYSISSLASEFDITTRALRFYEEKGLLRPRREGQKRIYSAADRVRLRLLLRGKRLGLSLTESQEIIDMYDTQSGSQRQLQRLLDTLAQRRLVLNQQARDIRETLADLKDVEQRCRDAIEKRSK